MCSRDPWCRQGPPWRDGDGAAGGTPRRAHLQQRLGVTQGVLEQGVPGGAPGQLGSEDGAVREHLPPAGAPSSLLNAVGCKSAFGTVPAEAEPQLTAGSGRRRPMGGFMLMDYGAGTGHLRLVSCGSGIEG